MDREPTQGGNVGPLGPGDDIAKLTQVAQQAIAEGQQVDDKVYVSIPVDKSMSYWGTGIWQFTDGGRMVRANDLFSEIISGAVGKDVRINGFNRRSNPETGDWEYVLMATVSDPIS